MKVNHTIHSSVISFLLLSCGSTFAHPNPGSPFIRPTNDQPRIPLNFDDGGLKVTFHLSKDKVNPLDYVGVRPWSGNSDHDLIATVTLHNTNPFPITIGWTNTPLDNTAEKTGVFRLYSPPGWREIHIEFPLIQRYWPEGTAPLDVTIPAGEMIEATHVLRDMTWYLSELVDGKYVFRVEGEWLCKENWEFYCFMSPGVEVEVLHQPRSFI
ncbi:hypothetical protein EV426DRAFT_703787 [Tirmania nivea]|nr:hypothetical protein EV426DRAFT_703787 [Tirmania nivea]